MTFKEKMKDRIYFPVMFSSDGKYIIFNIEKHNDWDVILYDMLQYSENLDKETRFNVTLYNSNSKIIQKLSDMGISKIYIKATDENIKKVTSFALQRYKKGGDR